MAPSVFARRAAALTLALALSTTLAWSAPTRPAAQENDARWLAAELDTYAATDIDQALWRIRCVHMFAEDRDEALDLLRQLEQALQDERLVAAARARLAQLSKPDGAWPLEEEAFEAEVQRLLELEPRTSAVRAEGLELRLEFHGDITLIDGTTLPWDTDRQRPYLRAALRWLQAVRGVRGRDAHTFTFHIFSLPFAFGNGFATPLFESMDEVGDNWLPRDAMLGINSFLYETGVQSDPAMKKEVFDNAMHEMGHGFGVGALWNIGRTGGELDAFHPLDDEEQPDAVLRQWVTQSPEHGGLIYRAPAATAAFSRVHGGEWDFVPISSDGGHLFALFDEEQPRSSPDGRTIPATEAELMSHKDVLSEITLGFLDDFGWRVDYDAAEELTGLVPSRASATPQSPTPTSPIIAGSSPALADDPLAALLPKLRVAFGVQLRASATTPDAKLNHAAAVLAEYLDNDEDGYADQPAVVAALQDRQATLVMFKTQDEAERVFQELPWDKLEDRALQDLYAEETHPGGAARGVFDASLEEVLHIITHAGYAEAFPEVFGEGPGSTLADLMDVARGGRFEQVPDRYPTDAWYSYDDTTCEYECMVTEYVYWGLTSLLGAQEFPGRGEEIGREWKLNTPAKLREGDPGLHELLTSEQWRLPKWLPDGKYR